MTQNAIAASQGYILPVIPDAVSSRGVPHLIETVFKIIDKKLSGLAEFLASKGKHISTSYISDTKLFAIVISMIREHGPAASGFLNEHTENLGILQTQYGKKIIKQFIPLGTGVPECLANSLPVYECSSWPNVYNRSFVSIFQNVTSQLKHRIDLR